MLLSYQHQLRHNAYAAGAYKRFAYLANMWLNKERLLGSKEEYYSYTQFLRLRLLLCKDPQ